MPPGSGETRRLKPEAGNARRQVNQNPKGDTSLRASWAARSAMLHRHQIVVRSDDAPPPVLPHPCVGEPVATLEPPSRPATTDDYPPDDARPRTKAIHAPALAGGPPGSAGQRASAAQAHSGF